MPPIKQIPRRREDDKQAQPSALGMTTTVTTAPTYTVTIKDRTVLVDDDRAGAAVRVVLPAVASSKDREIRVKKLGSSYAVTVDGNGSEKIDNATTQIITTQYDAMHLVCDGAKWWII